MTDAHVPPQAPTDLVGCTVISKNYLSHARILAQSFQEHHPGSTFVVLLCDRIDGYFDPENEPFEMIDVSKLEIPCFQEMSFRYNVIELDTAVKPFFFRHLFARGDIGKLIFFDPDILITAPLTELSALLDRHAIILTPHMTAPVDDGRLPSEQTILQAGVHNLGFIAMRKSATTDAMLYWWGDRLNRYCFIKVEEGLFVDQKWMDLAPGYFGDVHLLRHPGYNVAFWNLHERMIGRENARWTVNGEQLFFFHFSGYDPLAPHKVSRHQTRIMFAQRTDIEPLFEHYRMLQMDAGYSITSTWPYAFGQFDNGTEIDLVTRRTYDHARAEHDFGNPFATTGTDSFYSWMQRTHWNALQKKTPTGLTQVLRKRHEWEPYQRFTRELKSVIGPTMFYALKNALSPSVKQTLARQQRPASIRSMGVNVAGHLTGELGIGEAVRGHVRALQTTSIPYALQDVTMGNSRKNDTTFARELTTNAPYDISLIEVNADGLPDFYERKGATHMQGKYCIGHWAWELQHFPEEWHNRFNMLHELWVASSYVQAGLSVVSPVPVLTMPYVVERTAPGTNGRAHFDIPPDRYTYLFIFDFFSVFERKNPLAVIKAFHAAFKAQEPVQLVLKFSNAEHYPLEYQRLADAVGGDARITLLNGYLSKDEVSDLIACCDAYVSLHRSEGFGLTMAEAMLMGKPVIATGYSGNMDFMTEENSFPVPYRISRITIEHRPYAPGNEWAEPDVGEAAKRMRQVYEEPARSSAKALKGQETILRDYNAERIGVLMKQRLEAIRSWQQ